MSKSFITSKVIGCPHAFSTRLGGVSEGIYATLNLGQNRGDTEENVKANWVLFGRETGLRTDAFVYGKQVHEANVRLVGPGDAHPICDEGKWEPADGYVTDVPGLGLAIFTADCAPLLMHDPVAGVIAAVHCGWRSTAMDIMAEAVRKMTLLGAKPENICGAVGPCIGPCCFQTGAEVPAAMRKLLGDDAPDFWQADTEPEKFKVDLAGVIFCRLEQLGLQRKNMEKIGGCTMCQPERYWSHRYTKGVRGSQANMIML